MWQWQQFINLFFETPCSLCQRSTNHVICSYCRTKLNRCQIPIPQSLERSSIPVLVWGDYSGELRRAIAAFKYENQPMLGLPLGQALGETWNQLNRASFKSAKTLNVGSSSNIIAVPIPMHPTKLKQRGFNQASIIAEAFCKTTGIPLEKRGLQRIRDTKAQFSLSAQEREQNLVQAFEPCPRWKRRSPKANILLIDDIYTTGSTVKSAAQSLRNIGCTVVGVAAVARPTTTQPPHQTIAKKKPIISSHKSIPHHHR